MGRSEIYSHHQETLDLWRSLGAELLESSTTYGNQRTHSRFLVPDAVCHLGVTGSSPGNDIEVTVRDVSSAGACLISPTSLPISQSVLLAPPEEIRDHADCLSASVAYCRKGAGYYRVGVKFDCK